MIPGDVRLVSAKDLFVIQATLTGESLPAEKDASGAADSTGPDARNLVFLGTSVVSGTAVAIAIAAATTRSATSTR
jgi:Mg2+-importing ATPase